MTQHVATVTVDPAFRIGPVDRRLFGTFVEHMGRCVHTGIHEPGHATADDLGFRRDVADLVRRLGPTVVRYPGGNFVSSYRWEDGIGPRAERPRRLDLAWRTVETNEVGVDEFVAWSRGVAMEPIMAVNLGTRGVQEATDLLEYCNHPGGTRLSDLRRASGTAEPHDIRMWCLGNELDAEWQVGHKTAHEYGRLAAETARAMRMVDPRIELVACGSSNSTMPTFASWEREVLEHCYELVDHVSLHAYYDPDPVDVTTFLASARDLDRMITAVAATADHVGARLRSRRRLTLAVDEWNVWHYSRFAAQHQQPGNGPAELVEDVYDVHDAVVVGSLLITLLRHADRVAIGCQAQLVNMIAPILTRPGGGAWTQTTFHPFAQAAAHARGDVLRVEPQVATYEDERFGDVPLLEAVATLDEDREELTLLCVNRSVTETVRLDAVLRAFPEASVRCATVLHDDDPGARNTEQAPDRVVPRPLETSLEAGALHADLPPVSWAVIRATTAGPGPVA
jgi:alpha-L-arabinofuranosidase